MKSENIFSDSWGESVFWEKWHVWVQIVKIPGLAFTNRHVHASINKKCKYEFKKARNKLPSIEITSFCPEDTLTAQNILEI